LRRHPFTVHRSPFIQKVHRLDMRLLSWNDGPNLIPTRDDQILSVDTTARWRIADPLLFYQMLRDERVATTRLGDILHSVVRDHISGNALIEIVRSVNGEVSETDLERIQISDEEDEETLPREATSVRAELVASILASARKLVPDFGIELVDVQIELVDYVAEVEQ